MPRDIIPAGHNSSENTNADPILTASPEMKSPGNTPSLGSSEDRPMVDISSTSSQETEDDLEGEDFDEEHQGRNSAMSGKLAFQLFRDIDDRDDPRDDMEVELSQKFRNNEGGLHPYVQVLSVNDLDGCVAVENAAFPEDQRASREKLAYRLKACPYICLGLFTSTTDSPTSQTETMFSAARAPNSQNPSHKALLIGHIISTLTTSPVVTEESMQLPTSASSTDQELSEPLTDPPTVNQSSNTPGHHPLGQTLAIHSIAIHPSFQRQGLGRVLLKSYLQRMEGSGIADRAALLAKKNMVDFYVSGFGFEDVGESDVKFGTEGEDGKWRNLVTRLFGYEK